MSALKPLTVNEAIEKLTKLQAEGKGDRMLVFETSEYCVDGEYHTLHGFENALVEFYGLEPTPPLNRTQTFYGQRVIRPGRPKGTTPVVRIY